jgi:hypothetical protein
MTLEHPGRANAHRHGIRRGTAEYEAALADEMRLVEEVRVLAARERRTES